MSLPRGARWIYFGLIAVVWGLGAVRAPNIYLGLAALAFAAVVIHIAVHEAGHAVVCWLTGIRVLEVVTGAGPLVTGFRLGRTDIQFRLLPLGGYTRLAARHPDQPGQGLRARLFLSALAGPAATMALAWWATDLFPASVGWFWDTPSGVRDGVQLSSLIRSIGLILTIQNLLPWPRHTDGGQMWNLLTMSDSGLDEAGHLMGASETMHHLAKGNIEAAIEVSEGATTNSAAVAARAAALTMNRQWADARELLLPLLSEPMPEERQLVVANNLAWAAVHMEGPELLAEADRWSRWAMKIIDQPIASVLSTRGRVLLELGRPKEARTHLDACLRLGGFSDESRAEILGARSLARLELGDPLGGRADADEAYALTHEPEIVLRARAAADQASLRIFVANTTVGDDGRPTLSDDLRSATGRPILGAVARQLRRRTDLVGPALLEAGWSAPSPEQATHEARALLGLEVAPPSP